MFYTQLNDKSAKCKNVRIESNIAEELLADIKKLTKAGVIKVVYVDCFEDIAQQVKSALRTAGYNAEVTLFDGQICFEELSENSEGIVLLGSILSEHFWGKRCFIVSENLDMFDILHKEYHTILASFEHIKQSNFDLIANCYGKLMTRYLACFDFKLSTFCYCKSENLQVVAEIENSIKELFSQSYVYHHDQQFVRDLLVCVLNVGLLESMLDDQYLLCGYDTTCKVVQAMAKSKKLIGEYAMLVGWFGFCTAISLVSSQDSDLFLPCDIVEDVNYVASKTSCKMAQLLQTASAITAKDFTRFGFILKEYTGEIKKYLNSIFPVIQNGMKNFRRIYFDVGAEISTSITMSDLSVGVQKSVIFNPNYSYLKTMRVLGAV